MTMNDDSIVNGTVDSWTVEDAAKALADALRSQHADRTKVESTLGKVRDMVHPPPTTDESRAYELVQEAVGAQRAVALFRTEKRLYRDQIDRMSILLDKLRDAAAFAHDHYFSNLTPDDDNGKGNDDESGKDKFVELFLQPYKDEEERLERLKEKASEMEEQKLEDFLSLRQRAHKDVATLLLREEKEYRCQFKAALTVPGGEAAEKDIYTIIDGWSTKIQTLQRTTTQPVPEKADPTTDTYLHWIKEQSEQALKNNSVFAQTIQGISDSSRGVLTIAPLKSHSRIVEKTQDKYKGDYSKVLDYVRAMIVFDSLGDLSLALRQLDEIDRNDQLSINVVRAKDRMSTHYDTSLGGGGYRDVLLNLKVPVKHSQSSITQKDHSPTFGSSSKNTLVVELQLHLTPFLNIKNNSGHLHYEAARSVHMFNSVLSTRRFLWVKETPEDEIAQLLEDVRAGLVTTLDLDYSSALWDEGAQDRLADAFRDHRCALREISLRSCRCGDRFIAKCLNEDFFSTLPDLPPICSVIRLGSKIHQGRAGVISGIGIGALLRYFNFSLRELDLEGCLDENLREGCGDDVIESLLKHANEWRNSEQQEGPPLPNLYKLNILSTGLTESGFNKMLTLQERLPHLSVLHEDPGPSNKRPKRVSVNENFRR